MWRSRCRRAGRPSDRASPMPHRAATLLNSARTGRTARPGVVAEMFDPAGRAARALPETARELAARHDPALLPKCLTPQDVRPARSRKQRATWPHDTTRRCYRNV